MKSTVSVFLILLAALMAGCSSNNISVNATSEDKNIFEPSPQSEKSFHVPSSARETAPGRPPFINLNTYDWNYAQWLESFSERISELRMPASVDTYVEIVFYPKTEAQGPKVSVECTATAADCSRLAAQIEALPTLPRLPSDFPYPDLVVKLSRVP